MHTAVFRDTAGGRPSFTMPPPALQSCLAGFPELECQNSNQTKAIQKIPKLGKALVCIEKALENSRAVKAYEWMDPTRYRHYSISFQRILPAIRITWQDGWSWITWVHLDIFLEPSPIDIQLVRTAFARRNVHVVNIDRHHINQFALALSERELRGREGGQASIGSVPAAYDREYQARLNAIFRSILRDAGVMPARRVQRVQRVEFVELVEQAERQRAMHDLRSVQRKAIDTQSRDCELRAGMARCVKARRPVRQASLL